MSTRFNTARYPTAVLFNATQEYMLIFVWLLRQDSLELYCHKLQADAKRRFPIM